jgi:hypothetical protein
MAKLVKRLFDAAEPDDKDYVIWDDELPGFGVLVFASRKRRYVLQYRVLGRSRSYCGAAGRPRCRAGAYSV